MDALNIINIVSYLNLVCRMIRLISLKVVLFLVLCSSMQVRAQEKWTLRMCIDYALENSIAIKQAQINVRTAQITRRAAVESRYPSLDLSTNAGLNFGRNIDPTTNSFETQTLGSNSVSINTGMLIFDGNRINNTVKQAKIDILASQKDLETAANDLALQVAQSYLSALLNLENVDLARANLAQINQQVEQTRKLVDSGARASGELYEILSQQATSEQNLVIAENNYVFSLLDLKQLLLLSDNYVFEIERPEIPENIPHPVFSSDATYEYAVNNQPQIAAGDLKLQSAKVGEAIAKAGYYPTLSIFGQLNTFYSSLAKRVDGFNEELSPPTTIVFNGISQDIQFFNQVPILSNKAYFTQFNENLGIGVGVQLSVPIYDNGRTRANVERARLTQYSTSLQNEQLRQQLRNNVERAVTDANAGKTAYEAAKKSSEAAAIALRDAERRYAVGAANGFELTNAQTRVATTGQQEIIAKYEYIFRLKVVDFYSGTPISL